MAVDRPVNVGNPVRGWGSDAIAECLRDLGLEYIALNPGSSYRGLHDSLVNYLGNETPEMLLCIHEEQAVAIAHGYAKITGRPMGVILHANVGLMHAVMAIYNAWCDRVPMLIMGGMTHDAAVRRPWIDWVHQSADLGGLIRNFIKWDNTPQSLPAAIEALHRAALISRTSPCGPTYVALDAHMQEAPLAKGTTFPDASRFQPAPAPAPPAHAIREAAKLLAEAKSPVILAGRVSRNEEDWKRRVALAERLGARVLTDLRVGAAFPTDHPLHGAPPIFFLSTESMEILSQADVVLSLNWLDLGGALKSTWKGQPVPAKIIQASDDQYVHNGFSMDHHVLPPVDVSLLSAPDVAVSAILSALDEFTVRPNAPPGPKPDPAPAPKEGPITLVEVAGALQRAVGSDPVTMVRLPLGWPSGHWHFRHPLDFLGYDGGGGVGSGPGLAIGAAIGLKGTGRLAVAVIGDGEYMMSTNALWTAAHYGVPVLILVANNHSFLNDELHQDRVARERDRPPENRWIGMRVQDPAPDLAGIARMNGLEGIGPVTDRAELAAALVKAVEILRSGKPCVVDLHVASKYENTMAQTMVQMRPGS